MRRFRDLIRAHKKAWFGLWILVLVAGVAGAQWWVSKGNPIRTEVLGASQSIPPAPTITSGPSSPTASTTATFTYADTQNGVGFQCKLDAGAFTSCAKGGVTYTGLTGSPSPHTFQVAAQQGNGPLSAPSATWSWSVVIPPPAPPTPVITSGPASSTIQPDATFVFSDTQSGVGFQCKLDSAAFASCTSPAVYEGLAAGSHTFSVQAVSGSATSTTASFSWTITSASFTISGNLDATLAPGVSGPLNLVFTNPYNNAHGINVTGVTVTVQHGTVKGGVANPACDGPDNIAVTQASFTPPVNVPRNSTRSLSQLGVPQSQWPQIAMRNLPTTNQDACKGTTFNFSYTGTATKS